MPIHAFMPIEYWDETFYSSTFFINQLPNPHLSNKSSFEMLFGKILDYSLLEVFGCLYYPCIRLFNSKKLESRALPCTYTRYNRWHKCYKRLALNDRLYINRNVFFHEIRFPFSKRPIQYDASTKKSLPIIYKKILP